MQMNISEWELSRDLKYLQRERKNSGMNKNQMH